MNKLIEFEKRGSIRYSFFSEADIKRRKLVEKTKELIKQDKQIIEVKVDPELGALGALIALTGLGQDRDLWNDPEFNVVYDLAKKMAIYETEKMEKTET